MPIDVLESGVHGQPIRNNRATVLIGGIEVQHKTVDLVNTLTYAPTASGLKDRFDDTSYYG